MEEKISLNLVIDEVENRVVFAEGDRDFVDMLLSFLVMPVGSLVRLTDSKSQVGCMDTLYQSLESLDAKHFNTRSCKKMLLFPATADRADCKLLVVQIDDYSFGFYRCQERNHGLLSSVKYAKCSTCGKVMDFRTFFLYPDGNPSNVGLFLKGMNKYLITDDLQISTIRSLSLEELRKKGIYDVRRLREKKVMVGRLEVLELFNRALLSKTVLSDTFIKKMRMQTAPQATPQAAYLKQPSNPNGRKMVMDLVVNKSKGKFLYALAKEDVANFFFSFLTFPLGVLSNLYNGSSSLGCIDQLRSSAELLSEEGQLRTDDHLTMLLKPKISAHYGVEDQILDIEEREPSFSNGVFLAVNPKKPFFTTEKGGSFVNGPATFMISDNLEIKAASISKDLSVIRMLDDIEIIPVKVGEKEALKLLYASLTSSTPLSTIFYEELQANKTKVHHKFFKK